MSRVGNKIITLPEGVSVTVAEGNTVTVTGPKGTLTKTFCERLTISVEGNILKVSRPDDEKTTKQLHGTTRALLNGMVEGITVQLIKHYLPCHFFYQIQCFCHSHRRCRTINLLQ